jgi:hypothetical protein
MTNNAEAEKAIGASTEEKSKAERYMSTKHDREKIVRVVAAGSDVSAGNRA